MIDETETHGHHGKSGIKWLDLALAVSVVALSGASLLTAQHTGHTMEKLVEENSRLVRANATPLLQFETSNINGTNREMRFFISNVGTGTARLIWLEIRKGGVPQRNAIDLIDYQPKAAEQDYVAAAPATNTYLPAGEERAIISWRYPSGAESQSRWNALDTDRYQLETTACFCSVLDECWTSNLKADVPVKVKNCEPGKRVSFGLPSDS